MTPTQQQLYCVKVSQEEKMVKIEAVSGSGKTSTLELISESITEPSIYLAFNKAIATEAEGRFPTHVMCRTTHSVAFEHCGRNISHKLSRPKGKYVNVAGTGSEIAKYYKIVGVEDVITAAAIGLHVKKAVERFEQSKYADLSHHNVPTKEMEKALKTNPELADYVLGFAKRLWKDRCNENSPVLASHDTYLKLFQMTKPILPFKIVYADEAQDVTPCVLDIILNQRHTSKVIFVGDSFQNIYQFRGAYNAMARIECKAAPLSMSFRYGAGIAKVATCILNDEMIVEGRTDLQSIVGLNVVNRTKPYMMIFRTNALLLTEAVDAVDRGEKVKIEIDVRDFVKVLQSAESLCTGDDKAVKHQNIVPYPSWFALKEESKEVGGELARLVAIIEGGRAPHIISVLDNYNPPENATATYTTGHKSKGRQKEQVILAEDFPSNYKKGAWIGLNQVETNLLYVSATRAQHVLEINSTVREILDKCGVIYSEGNTCQ